MAWLSLLVALLKIAGSLTGYLQSKQLIDAAQADMLSKLLEDSLDIIAKAQSARNAATAKFDANGGVPDANDPNLRD